MTQPNGKRALLLGAYGQTNLGDDLLMYNYLTYISSLGFSDIHVNASEARHIPAAIHKQFPGLQVFETYNTSFLTLLKLMRQADAIFYGGGTVYKELYSSTGRGRYTVITRVMLFNLLAKLLGKKVFGLHIGIGTIKTGFGRLVTRLALLGSTHTTFRDNKSYAYARNVLHVPERLVSHSTDGLFLDPHWRGVWHNASGVVAPADKHVVGINVLSDIPDWVDRANYITTMRAFVRRLLENGNHVVFLPFQTAFNDNNDLKFINKEIIPHLRGLTNYHVAADVDITNIVSYLQQLDVLVGMRFHSLLLATAAGTPFLAIAYDTKCWRFVTEAGYAHAIKIEDLTADTLEQAYDKLLADKASAKTQLASIADTNFNAANVWKRQAV